LIWVKERESHNYVIATNCDALGAREVIIAAIDPVRQQATTMFFPHLVGHARLRGPHQN
jgi:hypothetical protein